MDKVYLRAPTLILGVGISGSGKTTLLREVVRYVHDAFYIDKDAINDTFLLTIPNADDIPLKGYRLTGPPILRSDPFYQEHVRFQSYHYMLQLAKANLEAGKHPILEGNYIKEIRMGYLDEIVFPFFEGVHHKTKIVVCHADEETIRSRLMQRNLPRDADKLESEEAWRKFLEREPILPPELERYEHLKVDTTRASEENVRRTLEYSVA